MSQSLEPREREQILRAWAQVAPRLEPAAKLILFGSLAQGAGRPTSDIDLVVKSAAPVPLDLLAEIGELFDESDLVRSVDVLDYARLSPAMQERIDREGVILA